MLNFYTISLFLAGFTTLISGLIVYLNNQEEDQNLWWLFLNACASIWCFGYFFMITAKSLEIATASNLALHLAAVFIPFFYLIFVLNVTNTVKKFRPLIYLSLPFVTLFAYLSPTNHFTGSVSPKFIFNYAPTAGSHYIYFTSYFFILSIIAGLILLKGAFNRKAEQRKKLFYILFASIAGFFGGVSIFFLTFDIFLPPYLMIFLTLYPIIISYAMIKHRLFNIKLITTELSIVSLWLLILIRTYLSDSTRDIFINTGLLIGSIFIGILLMKSVLREVKLKENFEKLAVDLDGANKQLRFLDQQKSEFISIASHQLRSPLTAIKGYAAMITEDAAGKLDDVTKITADRIYQSSEHLGAIVEDLLNVSRIEQGKMQYNFERTDMFALTKNVIEALELNAKSKHLDLKFNADETNEFSVKADPEKIRQVVLNLVDNAIKYTEGGFIQVNLSKNTDNKIVLTVNDSGIGISQEVKDRLFEKFSRGGGSASKLHINGSGLGLYIAKKIVEAHKGKIWAESPGEGKGSTFFMELNSI